MASSNNQTEDDADAFSHAADRDSDDEMQALESVISWGETSGPLPPSIDSDGDHTDADSAVGGLSIMTSTMSLRSSIYQNVEENGRTYHRYKEGKYLLPNDEQEQERLDLQHALFGITLEGRLHLAPIGPNPQNVLDFACGTGIWAIEFAHHYPSSRVLGTDLSPIQPLYVPPGCRFEIDDAEDEWSFGETFDYIHGRALTSQFKDPKAIFRQAFNALEPGGYLELQDGSFPFKYIGEPPVDSALYKWNQILVAGAALSGRPWTNAPHYKQWLEEIGFEDVVEKSFYWPTSGWARGKYFRQIAAYWQHALLNGLEGISFRAMGLAGWSPAEIMAFLPLVRDDIRNTSMYAYFPINVVYGRKPKG